MAGLAFVVLMAMTWGPYSQAIELDKRRKIDVELEQIEGATSYELKVLRVLEGQRTGKPMIFKTTKPVWSAQINPGKYMLQLRSYDDRGVPGDWSEPFEYWVQLLAPRLTLPADQVQMKTKSADDTLVDFKWEAVPGAQSYRLVVESDAGLTIAAKTSETPSLQLTLPVAKTFHWHVTSLHPEGVDGEPPTEKRTFTVIGRALEKPQIEKPISRIVKTLTWKAVPLASVYDYALARHEPNGRWKQISEGIDVVSNQLNFDLANPSGQYRLTVKAKAPLRLDSPAGILDFEIKGGLRDPAAIESAMLKESFEKPSNYYFIASYFITQMNFSAKIYDANSAPRLNAVGGTGRLGVGYQDERQPYGAFGVVDLSGFNIANKNFTFASVEGHATYKLNWAGRGQSLVGAGLYLKQLPILQGTNATGFRGLGKISNIGPHVGMQYWLPFNDKLGLQLNARLYYSMMGKTEVGEKIIPTLSYQFGALGSYRLRNQLMGYAGYAYRLDLAHFAADSTSASSFASPGDINEIRIEGHYLNLILEYSY